MQFYQAFMLTAFQACWVWALRVGLPSAAMLVRNEGQLAPAQNMQDLPGVL